MLKKLLLVSAVASTSFFAISAPASAAPIVLCSQAPTFPGCTPDPQEVPEPSLTLGFLAVVGGAVAKKMAGQDSSADN